MNLLKVFLIGTNYIHFVIKATFLIINQLDLDSFLTGADIDPF